MSGLIQLIVRHLLTLLAAALAAHHFDNVSTSGGIALAVVLLLVGVGWSWIVKVLHLEDKFGDVTANESLKTVLGALISQGVTFLSGYFAIDANDPNLLALALVNTVASRYGVHQQIAHATPIDVAAAVKALAMMLCMLSLSSCELLPLLATPAAVSMEVSLLGLGADIAVRKGVIKQGQSVTIHELGAIVSDPTDPTLNKVLKLEDVGLKKAVAAGTLNLGDTITIKDATTAVLQYATQKAAPGAKQPVGVVPVAVSRAASSASRNRLKPRLQNVPACMQLAAR